MLLLERLGRLLSRIGRAVASSPRGPSGPAPAATVGAPPPVAFERLVAAAQPGRGADPLALASYGAAGWERLLRIAREEARASCAFVIDGRGLLVACAGEAPPEVEQLGIMVLASMDEADRIRLLDCETESLTFGAAERWTTGIRVRRAGADSLVLVLVGPCAVQDRALLGALRRAFGRLGAERAASG